MGRIGKKVLCWTLCLMMVVVMLPISTREAKASEDNGTCTIKISVVDADDSEEIGNAEIIVTKDDEDNTLVDSWTTVENVTHEVENVKPGNYIIKEVSSPGGYNKVETEIKFNVLNNGKITLMGPYSTSDIEVANDGTLILKNQKKNVVDMGEKYDGISWNKELQKYEISNYNGLLTFAKIVNGELSINDILPIVGTSACAFISDGIEAIDASASDPQNPGYDATLAWTPIGNSSSPYTGTFDGNGCTITGLTIESKGNFIGLFGYVGEGGIVRNVTLEGGSIKGYRYVGGVVGYNKGTVSGCHNTGDVEGGDYYLGGVAGYNDGKVSNCHNTGDVEGNTDVGGLVGWNSGNGEVSNCYNAGVVRSESGGRFGGVAGANFGTVSNCYNTGAVRSESGDYVGGVTGWNERIVSNCYNTGDVSGEFYVGGVAGWNSGNGEVSNCYNTGDVEGNSDVGGVAGQNIGNGTVSNCYYNNSICQIGAINGSDDGNNAKGLTTAQMTGENAKTSLMKDLLDAKDGEGNPVWIVRENSLDTYHYPHLKGFAYDATGDVKDWPATISSGYTYELDYDAFDYDGKVQKPKVTVKKNGDEVEGAPYSFTFVESVNAGEYTIEFENTETGVKGVIPYSIKKRVLKITARNQTILYNGKTQGPGGTVYVEKKEIEELFYIGGDGLADTHSISSIILDGQGNEAKTYEKELIPSNAEIMNTDGDVVTTNYEIEYIPGDLIISLGPVTLTANSGTTVTYDGTEKTVSGYTCSVEGLTFDGVTAGVSATKAGTYEVTFAGVKVNETKDFTGCYMVTKTENGTLTINKRPLTITADSDTKVYDKTALTKDSYTVFGLADGDSIKSVTISGSQIMKGSSENVPSAAKIVNAKGEDVTACYEITYKNGTLTVTAPQAPDLTDDQKPNPKKDLKEDGKEQILVLDPANLPEGYTIEYSTDGGKTWVSVPTGKESGEYTIEVFYKADENHTDFFGDTLNVIIQGVYNQTDSDGDWTKGSGKTYTFRIKKAFNDEVTYDNLTGVFVDGKPVEAGKDYTAAKGSAIITFAADYLETLSVGEHKIRVTFKDGEVTVPLKVLDAIATPAPTVDATPTTGDTSMPILWATLILLSMAGAAVVIERKRKNVA